MTDKTLLEVLQELSLLHYNDHVYKNTDGVICFQSQPLNCEKVVLFEVVHDEQDKRIEVYTVDSVCGLIKGAMVD